MVLAPEAPPMGDSDSKGRGTGGGGSIGSDISVALLGRTVGLGQ